MATVYSNHCCLESWLWTSKLSVSLFFTQPCTYFLAICLSRTLFFWFKLFVSFRFYSATLQVYRDSPLCILFVNLLGCHSVLLMHFVHPLYTFLKVPTPNLFTVQACLWSNQEIVTDISLLMQNVWSFVDHHIWLPWVRIIVFSFTLSTNRFPITLQSSGLHRICL